MSSIDFNEFNWGVIDEFRANAGAVGGPFKGAPMVLVTHTGEYQEKTDRVIPVVALTRA